MFLVTFFASCSAEKAAKKIFKKILKKLLPAALSLVRWTPLQVQPAEKNKKPC
jgi:hypothetical protein